MSFKSTSLFILFLLVDVLCMSKSFSRVEVDKLLAPEGFYWKSQTDQKNITLNLIAKKNDAPTKVQYVWNKASLFKIKIQREDNDFEVSVSGPGRLSMHSHPMEMQSLENVFLEYLEELNITYEKPEKIVQEKDCLTFSEMDDFIGRSKENKNIKLQNIIDEVKGLIQNSLTTKLEDHDVHTENKIYEILNKTLVKDNLLEAVIDQRIRRVSSFTLSPLLVLQKEKERFLQLLNRVSQFKTFQPVFWFHHEKGFEEKTKLALLMLITHNHVSEEYFVKGVIAQYGIQEGWQAMQAINRLYLAERKYWKQKIQQGDKRIDTELHVLLDDIKTYKFEAKYNENLVKVINPMDISDEGSWLPYGKLYQYYGGFILARLLKTSNIPSSLGPYLVKAAGPAYRFITSGKDSKQFGIIKLYFEVAAKHGDF